MSRHSSVPVTARPTTITTGCGEAPVVVRGTPDMVFTPPLAPPRELIYGFSALSATAPPPNVSCTGFASGDYQAAQDSAPLYDAFGCASYGLPENDSTFSVKSAQDDLSRRVDVLYPDARLREISQSEATSSIGMSLDEGSTTPDKTKTTGRRKYDALIDLTLPDAEKKKQRRILANRASARRSRERRKATMQKLREREKELKRDRDIAKRQLHEQLAVNMEMRLEIEALKQELDTARAQTHRSLGTLEEGFGEVGITSTAAMYPRSTGRRVLSLDKYD